MLEDRHYMRYEDQFGFRNWASSPVIILLLINSVVFALQCVNRAYIHSPVEISVLALSTEGLRSGFLWQIVTFQFLHVDFMHFLLNSIMLFLFGKPIESTLGNARFWEVYLAGGSAGGILQGTLGLLFPLHFGGVTMGASAGVSALLAMFCLLHRNAVIRLMLILPVKAFHVLIGSLAIATFFVLVPSRDSIAHAAHLGGMLAAIGYYQYILGKERRLFNWRPYADIAPRPAKMVNPASERKPRWKRPSKLEHEEDVSSTEFISREVDPILDKISKEGIQSLSPRERQILERARSKMGKR
jgi:membrane associated rhomboid family serine protease